MFIQYGRDDVSNYVLILSKAINDSIIETMVIILSRVISSARFVKNSQPNSSKLIIDEAQEKLQ